VVVTLIACNEVVSQRNESSQQASSCPDGAFNAAQGTLAGKVVEVVDGDTVDVVMSGCIQRIRLLGIDTPETFSENRPNEYGNITDIGCLDRWGEAATEAVMTALEGKDVEVVLDPEAPFYDSFGRVLAYVYVEGEDIGQALLENGLARVYTEGDSSRIADYLVVEQPAIAERRGLWQCAAEVGAGGSAPSADVGNCDPSYPDVCIPPPPPDLDCPDIFYAEFRVAGNDPHRFDGDGNGVGCER
jgi:micrococcal nuclease